MRHPPKRKNTDLSVTDLFCGAGGSSIGAARTGLRIRMAVNHWALAVETHNTNFPDADHDCRNVSETDPRRYPTTDILIASPECTTHSPAGGSRRRRTHQRDLFVAGAEDPSVVRSRATAFDVLRFADVHRYELIIVENVIEFVAWEMFPGWLRLLGDIGYATKVVSLNSMFCHPTPQSRDRVYIVAWRKGNRAPDLEFRPRAFCPRCERDVESVQTWKKAAIARGVFIGKYRRQYEYGCSHCALTVTPYYYAALNAIDFAIPAERIGDRARPLSPRTMHRIAVGLEKYGRTPLVVNVKQGERDRSRAWPATREMGTIPSWDGYYGLAAPFVYVARENVKAKGLGDALPTHVAAANQLGIVAPGFLCSAGSNEMPARSHAAELPALTTSERVGMVTPFLYVARTHDRGRALDEPLAPVQTGQHLGVIQGAALINLRDTLPTYELTSPLRGLTAKGPHDALIGRSPFLVSHYRTGDTSPLDDALPVLPSRDKHALIHPAETLEPIDLEDCYFRMLQPPELGRGMAFPETYIVHGTKSDRVKQYGNAVTPPAMELLIDRCVASLHPERRRFA